jgi:hypothetical protein
MQKIRCTLPRIFRSMCETGCVYREPQHVAARCRFVAKSSPCAGPCPLTEHCQCRKSPPQIKLLVSEKTKYVDME